MQPLRIDEQLDSDGVAIVTTLALTDGGALELVHGAAPPARLPVLAVERVFARFGRELDPDADGPAAARLDLGAVGVLRPLRFHAIVDAEARDYLVLDRPGEPPSAALATTIAGALRHLARR